MYTKGDKNNISLTVITNILRHNETIYKRWADLSLFIANKNDDPLRHTDLSKEWWKGLAVYKVPGAYTVHISSYLWMSFPVQLHWENINRQRFSWICEMLLAMIHGAQVHQELQFTGI